MRKSIYLLAALALSLAASSAQAAPAWKCAKSKCFWVEYSGAVPDYASGWGPPRENGCYWSYRKLAKKWREVCPSTIVH